MFEANMCLKMANRKLHDFKSGIPLFLVICDYSVYIIQMEHISNVKFHRGYEKNISLPVIPKSPIQFDGVKLEVKK